VILVFCEVDGSVLYCNILQSAVTFYLILKCQSLILIYNLLEL